MGAQQIQITIKSEAILNFAGKTELSCTILDADDEWMKISYIDKKDKQITKLLRIEAIDEIEIEERFLFVLVGKMECAEV